MKWKGYLILSIFVIFLCSCTKRYIVFTRSVKKFERNKITRVQYDSILNTFYVSNKNNFKLSNKIKLLGSYVCEEYSDYYKKNDYRTLKFTDSGYVYVSYRFYQPLDNATLIQTQGTIYRHSTKDKEILMEYLLSRDYELYNIFKYGKISDNGDTLTFYKTENLQRPNEKKRPEKVEMYIYNPNITALPILPQ